MLCGRSALRILAAAGTRSQWPATCIKQLAALTFTVYHVLGMYV
jgi:hypothetical protein